MTEITKESLFEELVNRHNEQLGLVKKLEERLRVVEDVDEMQSLSRSYQQIATLYEDTCKNIAMLKGWNYLDPKEKKAQIDNVRELLKSEPKRD